MDDVDGELLRVRGEWKKTMETGTRETLVQKLRSMERRGGAPEVWWEKGRCPEEKSDGRGRGRRRDIL
jgi:hypothetical protein